MNSTIEVSSGDFTKSLKIPTSKSYANRLLILASIFPGEITIEALPKGTDVLNLINCLKKIGLEITEGQNNLTILNSFPQCERMGEEILLETGDGGTTNRFLIALLARGKSTYILKPDPVFLKRPIEGFLKELSSNGVFIEKGADFIKIRGSINLDNKELEIDSSLSTQFSSALALSLANTDVRVFSNNINSSKNYLELTNYLIRKFQEGSRFFGVPLDFSSLSYPRALAALTGSVLIENYQGRDEYQGDSIFLNLLKEAGASVIESRDRLFVEKSSNLKPLEIDCSGCLDLVPTLSFLFSHVTGITLLKNIKALSYKESDRIFEIQRLLNLFKKECRLTEDFELEIIGSIEKSPFVEYESPRDHRMIMTAYLFMRLNGGGIIKNSKFVDKSFPDFFKLLN
jgi:3-phosphoshikimate 1-carboxyvinyltransferase